MIDTNKKDSKEYMGKKIRLARTISNLTQEELAEKLSLTPEYVSQIERGISYGSVETLINRGKNQKKKTVKNKQFPYIKNQIINFS